ncbi:hypothetical protein PCANC_24192 [Puccinia coronata f. sp. avenae]|uniref:Alpha-galactosidase n=1 Tax=Puccinia coronata f. sp. avenae TaxID=200324 RepID=A0A2N5S8F4_9BASI|nr:hypothetical protein PCANC_24192 [Puccinia coronata f. sp. avenae]
MFTLATSRTTSFTPLLLLLCLSFFSSSNLADDNMTVFSTSSFDQSYQYNSTRSSKTTTYSDTDGSPSENPRSKDKFWCGNPNDPSFPLNSEQRPALLSRPLLNLRCTPKLKPYVQVDDPAISSLIVDAGLTYYPIEGAIEISDKVKQLEIVIINTNTSQAITAGIVAINTLGNQFQFPLTTVGKPSLDSYQILCQAYSNDEYITEKSVPFEYLPDLAHKGIGESVRVNSESGTIMVTNDKGALQTLIPFGFAVDYSRNYSASQLTALITTLKDLNVNTVQLILGTQGSTDVAQLNRFLNDLGKAGIWIQYDMRRIYWNQALVTSHINLARQHSNVLLYHTAMEPDGHAMEAGDICEASQAVRQNDPYHPVSITLSCQDYNFSNYTSGNDIILTNLFVIGANQHSAGGATGSNSIFGSFACDKCKGSFLDLVYQIRIFRDRRHALGRDRNMQIWGVPQANPPPNSATNFNVPTGEQFLLMCTIYIIEGAVGLMTWNEEMQFSPDLKEAVQTIGSSLPQIGRYLERPQSFVPLPPVNAYPNDTFIANIWLNTADQTILVMVANLAPQEVDWEVKPPLFKFNSTSTSTNQLQLSYLYISQNSHHPRINQNHDQVSLKGNLNGYGFGAWIIQAKSDADKPTPITPSNQ